MDTLLKSFFFECLISFHLFYVLGLNRISMFSLYFQAPQLSTPLRGDARGLLTSARASSAPRGGAFGQQKQAVAQQFSRVPFKGDLLYAHPFDAGLL